MECVSVRFIDRSVPLPGILHSMSLSSLAASLPVDGRQSATALAVARGTTRLLHSLGLCVISELPLPSGRRADLVALGADGTVWIIEIKSSVEDFRADEKWMDYRLHCDRLFFAVAPAFPREVLPADTGLIIADRYGGEVVREAPEHRLAGARRKAMTLRLVHTAASRLQAVIDPESGFREEPNA